MTTWSLDQVERARGYRATSVVAPEMLAPAKKRADVIAFVKSRLAREIVEMAQTWAIELHPGDVVFEESPADFGGVRIDAKWRPDVQEVELVGGPSGGEVYASRIAPDEDITVAIEVPMSDLSATVPDAEAAASKVDYTLAGWREEERRWVYSPRGTW